MFKPLGPPACFLCRKDRRLFWRPSERRRTSWEARWGGVWPAWRTAFRVRLLVSFRHGARAVLACLPALSTPTACSPLVGMLVLSPAIHWQISSVPPPNRVLGATAPLTPCTVCLPACIPLPLQKFCARFSCLPVLGANRIANEWENQPFLKDGNMKGYPTQLFDPPRFHVVVGRLSQRFCPHAANFVDMSRLLGTTRFLAMQEVWRRCGEASSTVFGSAESLACSGTTWRL